MIRIGFPFVGLPSILGLGSYAAGGQPAGRECGNRGEGYHNAGTLGAMIRAGSWRALHSPVRHGTKIASLLSRSQPAPTIEEVFPQSTSLVGVNFGHVHFVE
jgi:hypothetical protein